MKSLEALDGKVFLLYKNFSHAAYRFAGLTNYFFAKLAVVVVMLSIWSELINYWVPILSRKTALVPLMFNGIIGFALAIFAYQCDEANESVVSNANAKYDFFAFKIIPFDLELWAWRILCLAFAVFAILIFFTQKHTAPIIFDLLDASYWPAFMSFWYFLTVDPPSPAKSKLREWAENIVTAFKKLVPLRVSR